MVSCERLTADPVEVLPRPAFARELAARFRATSCATEVLDAALDGCRTVVPATAWTQRQLVLDSVPLKEVAEEFNRYSTRPLIVEDSGAHELRLSGVFSTDPDFLIRYLRERTDIRIQETDTEIHILRHD